MLVGGAAGVGKTALVDQLRPVVTGNDGWFVTGKFDQYRRDLEFDGIFQAFRALGRLLLAEPDDELVELRERMLAATGAQCGLGAAAMPEFAALLGVASEAGDPLTAQVRVQHSAVDTLRAVASRKRPVMVFVDDLQWAGTHLSRRHRSWCCGAGGGSAAGGCPPRRRAPGASAGASLSRWRDRPGVTHLHLVNLAGPQPGCLGRRNPASRRGCRRGLAALIEPHTAGNPYETAELLNTLRQEGVLTPDLDRVGLGRSGVRAVLASSEWPRARWPGWRPCRPSRGKWWR